MQQGDRSDGRSKRKPWDGLAGAPSGPKRPLEEFMDDLWNKRASAIQANSRRTLTKKDLAVSMTMSKPNFNKYYADVGARWPFPSRDHLVYVVGAHDGVLRWLSPSVETTLRCKREDVVGLTVSKALRGGEDLAVTAPEIFEIGRRLVEEGEDEQEYSTYLVRWDDRAHIPVLLLITYGTGFDVFFVDAMITGEVDMSYAQPVQAMFNVDPAFVYTLKRTDGGHGNTYHDLENLTYGEMEGSPRLAELRAFWSDAFLEQLGYRS